MFFGFFLLFLILQFMVLSCFIEHLLYPTTVLGARDTVVNNTDISIDPLAPEVCSLRGQIVIHSLYQLPALCVCAYIFTECYKKACNREEE